MRIARATPMQHEHTQPPQITQARRHPADCKGQAFAIDSLIGVLLSPHRAPKPFRGELGHGRVCDAGDNPAEHIGIERLQWS